MMPYTRIRYYKAEEIQQLLLEFSPLLKRIQNMSGKERMEYANKLAEHAYVFGFEEDGHCKGIVAFYANDPAKHTAYCSLLAGYTMGTVLLVHMEEFVKELGFREIQLEVAKENIKAQAFYEKHQYKKMEYETEESVFRSKFL